MRICIKIVCLCMTIISFIAIGVVSYWQYTLPESYKVQRGNEFQISDRVVAINTENSSGKGVKPVGKNVGDTYLTTLKWLGIFPIKTVSVEVVDTPVVILGGIPFGIKLYTDGVLVVSLSNVDAASGKCCPAKEAGIKVGDSIVSINGETVYTNQEVAELVERSSGKPLKLIIRRDNILSTVTVVPQKSLAENCYKAGMWVRDSSAGIGTVTFYDPNNKILAGLGHPICDVDTGAIMPISTGEIVPARIYGINKSVAGTPGELRGGFEPGSYGRLLSNNRTGVYSKVDNGMVGETIQIAMKQDVKVGKAKMRVTLSGQKPEWYDIQIKQVNFRDPSITRNMVIEITDKQLLNKTGGIVQGMSGSPLIQNGKLIGAVTHVLIDDPTKGYGIFAENMLETAQSVAESNKLKEAS